MKEEYKEELLEKLTEAVKENEDFEDSEEGLSTEITDEQKTYFWIRLFIKDEDESDVEVGDDITIEYKPSGEKMVTKFISFSKKGLDKDSDKEIDINEYQVEEDKKVMILMVDEKVVNHNKGIPFIRTLFKQGNHYEYQLLKRTELTFTDNRSGDVLDYYECSF